MNVFYKVLCCLLFFSVHSFYAHANLNWHGPINIFSADQIFAPKVSVDPNGNAIIMGTQIFNQAAFYTGIAKLTDGTPEILTTIPFLGVPGFSNAVSVNSSGNASTAWLEITGVGFVRSYTLSTNLTTTISDADNFSLFDSNPIGLTLDNSNQAIALWSGISVLENIDIVQYNLYKNNAWQTMPTDLFFGLQDIQNVVLSGSPSGKALGAWLQGSFPVIHASYYDGNNWTTTLVSSDVCNCSESILSVSMNVTSNGIILWNDSSSSKLKSVNFSNGIYSPHQTVYITPSTDEVIEESVICLSDNGSAIALWTTNNSVLGIYKVMANIFTNGVWGTAATIDQSTTTPYESPNIGMDAKGNGIAVWEKRDVPLCYIYYNYYKQSTNTWLTNSLLLSSATENAEEPNLSMNALGFATIVWTLGDFGNQTIQAVYFQPPPLPPSPLPPQNFQGKQFKNQFFSQADVINQLNWTASSSQDVDHYLLYRNGIPIASIPANNPLTFKDHNRNPKINYLYLLKTILTDGSESEPVSLKIERKKYNH